MLEGERLDRIVRYNERLAAKPCSAVPVISALRPAVRAHTVQASMHPGPKCNRAGAMAEAIRLAHTRGCAVG